VSALPDPLPDDEALLLSVHGVDGWPHTALLSAGEVVALPDGSLRLALHAGSGTSSGLIASGRALLLVAAHGAVRTLRLRARLLSRIEIAGTELACFTAAVEDAAEHRAPYADLLGGPRFRLRDAEATRARWRATVEALRGLEAAA
jgi:hypothetical protein